MTDLPANPREPVQLRELSEGLWVLLDGGVEKSRYEDFEAATADFLVYLQARQIGKGTAGDNA